MTALPPSLRLALLTRSWEAAGVKLPMPGGDFGDGCSVCVAARMKTPLAVLPGNPVPSPTGGSAVGEPVFLPQKLRQAHKPVQRFWHQPQRFEATHCERIRDHQALTLMQTGPHAMQLCRYWMQACSCSFTRILQATLSPSHAAHSAQHREAGFPSYLLDSTAADGTFGAAAGLQVLARPSMPGARLAGLLLVASSASGATISLEPAS